MRALKLSFAVLLVPRVVGYLDKSRHVKVAWDHCPERMGKIG